jgi:hypothetical protein
MQEDRVKSQRLGFGHRIVMGVRMGERNRETRFGELNCGWVRFLGAIRDGEPKATVVVNRGLLWVLY